MTDPYLTLASAGGTMQSNEIASTGVGVEVKAGITGFGLPPVELQFDQSVGDGARYRGHRVLQRSVDLKFHVYGPTRASLRSTLDRISTILAHKVTLTFHDPDQEEEWSISGYRSGGGDYAYGITDDEESGTDGLSYVNLAVTLITETPYWEAGTTLSASRSDSGAIALVNDGTQSSPPVWTVRGPSHGFKATSPSGEVLEFVGLIGPGTVLTIDCEAGTVRDNYGANRYGDLAALPKFFHVPVGASEVTVELDQQSQDYINNVSSGRRNYVTNPNFKVGTTGWSGNGFVHDAANKTYKQTSTVLEKGFANRPFAETTVTGLTPGQNYIAIVRGSITSGRYGAGAKRRYSSLAVIDGGVSKSKTLRRVRSGVDHVLEFTAENSTVKLRFVPEHAVANKTRKFQRSSGYISNVFVGEPGAYFDGDTPDTATETYDWTGTPNNSQSTLTPVAAPPSTGAGVTLSFKPRKWLMI